MTEKITTSPFSFPPEVEPHNSVKIPSPKGLSAISDQITPSSEQNATSFILQVNRYHEGIIKNLISSDGRELLEVQKRMSHFRKEQLEVLQEKTKRFQQADTWSGISEIASYFANASTLALAIGQLSTGGVAGSFLLAAGGLGLSTRLIDLLGGWDYLASCFKEGKKNQQELARLLKTVANYVSLGAFLVSSGYTYTHSTFKQLSLHTQKALSAALTLFTGTTHAISKGYEYLVNSAAALLKTLESKETQTHIQSIFLSSNITSTTEEKKAVQENVRAIVLTQTPI